MAEPHPLPAAVAADPWHDLRRFTEARIALGRCGAGLPTTAHLHFQAAHAQARDAVNRPLEPDRLMASLAENGWPALLVTSAAADRPTYLQRPDLGRRLSDDSQKLLSEPLPACEVALVIADGLSSTAVHSHALPTLRRLIPLLNQTGRRIGPIIVASQARVALGDHIGALLQADLAVMLIGERPGLSAVDSLGLYLTWMPRPGRVDSERNCISNVRTGGLSPADAADQAAALVERIVRYRAAGIALAGRP